MKSQRKNNPAPSRNANRARNSKGKEKQNTQLAWDSVVKDELIQAVNGSVAFSSTEFPINPGMAATFPLGSPEAAKWTEWKCVYLEFYYRRTVSQYATQGTTGRVVLACDYSALNGAPTSLQQAEALHCAMGMPCDSEIRLRCDPNILNKADPKYIRTVEPSGHSDIRLFDGGNLWFTTSGCQNATEIGELRVKYHFKVRLPNLSNNNAPAVSGIGQYNLSADQSLVTSVPSMVAFNEVIYAGAGVSNSSGAFTLPEGVWEVQAEVVFEGASDTQVWHVLELQADGAALTPPCLSTFDKYVTGTTYWNPQVSITRVLESDGTTVVRLLATCTSAGTLLLAGDACRISFRSF